MRILFAILLICSFLLSGCQIVEHKEDDFSLIEIGEPSPDSNCSDEQIIKYERIEETLQKNTIYFKDQSFEGLEQKTKWESELKDVIEDYSELMSHLEHRGGILIAGCAYGLREGNWATGILHPRTLTTVSVEKIYFGSYSEDTIVVSENYCPVVENGEEYIEISGHQLTRLKDGQKVLLALVPASTAGVWWPCYYELPLPEDYQEFDDIAKQELFDYYRGDPNYYRVPQTNTNLTTNEKVNEDGTLTLEYQRPFDEYWPKQDISDEDLLSQLSENLLLRFATEFQIKIWPQMHIRYSATKNGFVETGIGQLSRPE